MIRVVKSRKFFSDLDSSGMTDEQKDAIEAEVDQLESEAAIRTLIRLDEIKDMRCLLADGALVLLHCALYGEQPTVTACSVEMNRAQLDTT